jgi:hypothetical protein
MKHPFCRVVFGCAVVLLAACEPALSPEPQLAPQPAPTQASFLGTDAEIDRVLQMLRPGQPMDPAARETLRRLFATLEAMPAPAAEWTGASTPAPVMEKALREIVAADGDQATVIRVLKRLAAEREAERLR